jgi:hypothetical protein
MQPVPAPDSANLAPLPIVSPLPKDFPDWDLLPPPSDLPVQTPTVVARGTPAAPLIRSAPSVPTANQLITEPVTYAEWAVCCDRLLKDDCDDETLAAMELGRLDWTSGVAERITKRLHEVFDSRLKSLAQRFQREIDQSSKHETLLRNALLGLRKSLLPLARLSKLPILPERVAQSLKQSLQEYATRTQSSLEASAKDDRSNRLLNIIQHTPVCVQDTEQPRAELSAPEPKPESSVDRQPLPRRIILI